MRVLVTGINGFVGSLLKNELVERGHEVYGIDREGDERETFSVDITRRDKLTEVISEISPDSIVHLAAITVINTDDYISLYSANVTGTFNLLASSAGQKRIPGILFVSSSHVYGRVEESSQPMDESLPLLPVNHYGASKAAGENLCRGFSAEQKVPVVIARPFNHFGAGQKEIFVIPKIIRAFKERRSSLDLGDIEVVRDFLDARDVVGAYISIIENFHNGEIYNISSGSGVRLSHVIETAEELTGHRVEIKVNNSLMRSNEMKVQIGNSGKIRKELGWSPVYSIKDTLRWMLEN